MSHPPAVTPAGVNARNYNVAMSFEPVPVVMVQGVAVPAFMYGTAWKQERTATVLTQALRLGFRAIDTANQRRHYDEEAVGSALTAFMTEAQLQRGNVFLQTKFTYESSQDHRLPYDRSASLTAQVEQSLASSLEHLKTQVIDSYLLHGPWRSHGLSDEDWEVWRSMERLHHLGKIKLLGISNVSVEQLGSLLQGCRISPAFVQNRCYARTRWDAQIRSVCTQRGISYQAFSLLTANRHALESATLTRIAQDTGASVAQLVFRFATQMGMIPLTGSSSAKHLREDLACFDFQLTPTQLQAIEGLAGLY